MCEIFVMIKSNNENITKKELEPFLKRAVLSASHNRDGYGVACETWYMKTTDTMSDNDVKDILEKYKDDSRFFIVHVRFATCEKKEEFNHPFIYERFLGVHNGVVTVDNEKSGSDSFDMFNAINKNYNGVPLHKAILKAMKNISGSYSVLMYEYETKSLYYYRNTPVFDFMFVPQKNIIYGATDIDVLKPLQHKLLGFFETAYESRPLRETLYRIDLSDGSFKRCGTVEEKPYTWVQNGATVQRNLLGRNTTMGDNTYMYD